MRTISVPYSKLPGLFRQYGAAVRKNTNSRLTQVVTRVKEIVAVQTANAPAASPNGAIGAIDTKKYLNSWKVSKAAINGIRGVLIANSAEYMAVIERGRGAGKRMPPLGVIAAWAQRRLGLPYKEARRAAWPIARKIGRRGLYARRVMTGKSSTDEYCTVMREMMGLAMDEASIRVFN